MADLNIDHIVVEVYGCGLHTLYMSKSLAEDIRKNDIYALIFCRKLLRKSLHFLEKQQKSSMNHHRNELFGPQKWRPNKANKE